MKRYYLLLSILVPVGLAAQSPKQYCNDAANQYIDVSKKSALATINEGLGKYPGDEDLVRLKEAIEEEEQNQEQQNQDQQQNEEGDQENQDQQGENNEQQEQENQEEENQEEEGEQEEPQEEKSQEQMTKEKLQEMGISEEKARQLLEAMRQSEIKYLQNQKRKATKRPPSGKPDW